MWIWVIGALANETSCAPEIAEFRHVVELRSNKQGTITETYRFPVSDPGCESVLLPARLNGMHVLDSDLVVLEGRLPRKASFESGQMLVVQATRAITGGPFSAEVVPPDVAVKSMSVEISAPSWLHFAAWADPNAAIDVSGGRTRRFQAVIPHGGRVVWTTERDWWRVGDTLKKEVEGKLIASNALEDRTITGIPDAIAQVRGVKLEPGGSWGTARSGREVLRSGRGTAAERGVVLISFLKKAGLEASPALVRPLEAEDVALAVPGRAMFPGVAVWVKDSFGNEQWLDPSSDYFTAGVVPIGLRGARVLVPGDLPRRLEDHLVPDGVVSIEGAGTVGADGTVEMLAQVSFEGAANQAVRDLLSPLKPVVREQWLKDLVTSARPRAEDLRIQLFGVDDSTLPIGLTVEFTDPGSFELLKGGLRGRILPVLAPQLGRVLAPNISVEERLEISSNELIPALITPVQEQVDPHAMVHRGALIEDQRLDVHTSVIRPWRIAASEERGEETLYAAAESGPEVVLFEAVTARSVRVLRKSVEKLDGAVLEALLWLEEKKPKKVKKALKRALRAAPVEDVVARIARTNPVKEYKVWEQLWGLLDAPADRLVIVRALARAGQSREAWRRALLLLSSEDPAVVLESLLIVSVEQGVRPPAHVDRAAHEAWRAPLLILKRAEKLAASVGLFEEEVQVRIAAELLAEERCGLAQERLQKVETLDTALSRLVRVGVSACLEQPPPYALKDVLEFGQYEHEVVRRSVEIWSRLGQQSEARRWALTGARLLGDRPDVWIAAASAAVDAGDLVTASYAARRASDLEPRGMVYNVPLQIYATLLGDAQTATLATRRSGYEASIFPPPIPLEDADRFVTEPQRLAFYRLRDAEILADRERLQVRMKLNEQVGDRLAAQRDAEWLMRSHKVPSAAVVAFRSTSDRVWSSRGMHSFGRARDPLVRKAQLELGLITGRTDAYRDTRYLRKDPEASLVRMARLRPSQLAKDSFWPGGRKDPAVDIPLGFRKDRVLGAMPGVVGMTHREAGAALLICVGEELPPPVEGVFSLGDSVLEIEHERVFRLEGASIPMFVSKRRVGSLTFWGVGPSILLARFAVDAGVSAQTR